jgi:hypothetical protein
MGNSFGTFLNGCGPQHRAAFLHLLALLSLLVVTVAGFSMPAKAVSNLTKTVIVAHPPDTVHFEKIIGYFTSTSHPSYFLGTDRGAYIFDPVARKTITVAKDGSHYEQAKAFYAAPTDKLQSVMASAGNGFGKLVAYRNPGNCSGCSAFGQWDKFVIYSGSGCHDLHVLDLDGDRKPDVACSATNGNPSPAYIEFQNGYYNWTHVQVVAMGDGIGVLAVNGYNSGKAIHLAGCNGGKLYWYQNPGGVAARTPGKWKSHHVGDCNPGTSIAGEHVTDSAGGSGRYIIVQASNETGTWGAWRSGLAYFDPGAGSNPTTWTKHIIDSTYRDVHQIAVGVLNGHRFMTVGEQEQASTKCNAKGFNHNGGHGCRVAIYPWTGAGFGRPKIVSTLGTQNQALFQRNGVEYMVGANHNNYVAIDPGYNLWKFTLP